MSVTSKQTAGFIELMSSFQGGRGSAGVLSAYQGDIVEKKGSFSIHYPTPYLVLLLLHTEDSVDDGS